MMPQRQQQQIAGGRAALTNATSMPSQPHMEIPESE